ncbi:hypothetical protein BDV96DRAFT_646495 [Lophiotrema nucula]|uniref:Uncharacterized protein n=1 Tax=Lophiotrema nucula TaxID=690887 RepID=A0A6A5Z9R8_9PLEO|nr:hypothetical protein BDV96DRAFT_646495 [Lophiotrema nucula]
MEGDALPSANNADADSVCSFDSHQHNTTSDTELQGIVQSIVEQQISFEYLDFSSPTAISSAMGRSKKARKARQEARKATRTSEAERPNTPENTTQVPIKGGQHVTVTPTPPTTPDARHQPDPDVASTPTRRSIRRRKNGTGDPPPRRIDSLQPDLSNGEPTVTTEHAGVEQPVHKRSPTWAQRLAFCFRVWWYFNVRHGRVSRAAFELKIFILAVWHSIPQNNAHTNILLLIYLILYLSGCWQALSVFLAIFRLVAAQENCSIVYVTVPGPIITVSLINAPQTDPAHGTYFYSVIDGTTQWLNSQAPPSQFRPTVTRTLDGTVSPSPSIPVMSTVALSGPSGLSTVVYTATPSEFLGRFQAPSLDP